MYTEDTCKICWNMRNIYTQILGTKNQNQNKTNTPTPIQHYTCDSSSHSQQSKLYKVLKCVLSYKRERACQMYLQSS